MNSLNKTFLPIENYKNRNWYIIDCKGQTLGRLATIVTKLLKGKLKSHYYPAIDTGDYVILINADLIILNQKSKHYLVYHPGRPGHSLKIRNVSDCLSTLTIKRAIKRMLSETEAKRLMKRLKVISNNKHMYQGQKPYKIDIENLYSNIK